MLLCGRFQGLSPARCDVWAPDKVVSGQATRLWLTPALEHTAEFIYLAQEALQCVARPAQMFVRLGTLQITACSFLNAVTETVCAYRRIVVQDEKAKRALSDLSHSLGCGVHRYCSKA